MNLLKDLLSYFACFIVWCVPIIYIFLLVYTLAMKERDSKLKIREIMQGFFKKLF